MAFVLMGLGLLGVSLLASDIADPLFVYPEHTDPVYAIICIIMGVAAFLFRQEFLRQELDGNRKQFPPTLLGKTVKAMRDNF